ncbi:conserved hypothetical protein [Rippkaea orientalis PCC 8801]|uniref:Uncharacterized protein n=1 Tax=Rippkaea orientalis (strain PCC 8801 / RF-1) TaxID=41431 RepID=B7JZX5_RIPO1|nr:hypothetical protein [Rippkaea orientalis]ACK66122.1 conserved hypothetical protein [Rippkaea orientalis PCC 8801]
MKQTTINQQQEQVTYPHLPLAVYRELAAHLQQIPGVTTRLIPQRSQHFDYAQSQVDSIEVNYPVDLTGLEQQQLEAILDYYGQVYGTYERKSLS